MPDSVYEGFPVTFKDDRTCRVRSLRNISGVNKSFPVPHNPVSCLGRRIAVTLILHRYVGNVNARPRKALRDGEAALIAKRNDVEAELEREIHVLKHCTRRFSLRQIFFRIICANERALFPSLKKKRYSNHYFITHSIAHWAVIVSVIFYGCPAVYFRDTLVRKTSNQDTIVRGVRGRMQHFATRCMRYRLRLCARLQFRRIIGGGDTRTGGVRRGRERRIHACCFYTRVRNGFGPVYG